MIRNHCSYHEMNTITLSNKHLVDIMHCIENSIEKIEKEIKKCKKDSKSEEVTEVFESVKNNYQKLYYVLNEIMHETETQFNLDQILNGLETIKNT